MSNLDKNLTDMCEAFSRRNDCKVVYRHEMGNGYELDVTKDNITATVTIDQTIAGHLNIRFFDNLFEGLLEGIESKVSRRS